jgi:hypothetical protein
VTKRCRKMKGRHQSHLDYMGRKHNTAAEGEAAHGKGKGGDDASWADVNFTGPENKENLHGRFSRNKWMVKI